MDFLNFLMEPLKGDQKIVSLTYLKNEHVGQSEEDRRAVYDINCVTGEAHERGLAEGLERGIAQGERNASMAIAKNLLAQSLPLEIISAATGLSCQDLQALKEKT